MANRHQLFMLEDDERTFLRQLERHTFEVYPRRVPPEWVPFRATHDNRDKLPPEELYLSATEVGPVLVDPIKRGPDKGFWRVDEVRSPVIFWERCQKNEEGELLSGQLWAELDVTPQTGRRDPAPERFRQIVVEIEIWLRKQFRQGKPKGFWVGPAAARALKQGLVLRDSQHRGGTVALHR
jgi:hypothetical protein